MISQKYKRYMLAVAVLAVSLLAPVFAAAPRASAQTQCPRDPDYPAAGSTTLPSQFSQECSRQPSYVFVTDTANPALVGIQYSTSSATGTRNEIAFLRLQNKDADPLVWSGTASYDGHTIQLAIPRDGFKAEGAVTDAIRVDNPGGSNEAVTGVTLSANDDLKAFTDANNIVLGSGTANFEGDCEDPNPAQDNCAIIAYLVTFVNLLSALVGIIIIIMVIVGGIQYTTARGDAQAVANARNRIMNALMALVFYLFVFAFLQWLVPGGIF